MVVVLPVTRLLSSPVLVGDLEGRVPVADTSHEVEPSLGCALLAAPAPAQERHHSVGGRGELDVLTGLVSCLVELLADKVGDGPDHLLLLVLVLPGARPRHRLVHPDEVALARVTGDVAEILQNISLVKTELESEDYCQPF